MLGSVAGPENFLVGGTGVTTINLGGRHIIYTGNHYDVSVTNGGHTGWPIRL